jgi:hypothetical protein
VIAKAEASRNESLVFSGVQSEMSVKKRFYSSIIMK